MVLWMRKTELYKRKREFECSKDGFLIVWVYLVGFQETLKRGEMEFGCFFMDSNKVSVSFDHMNEYLE